MKTVDRYVWYVLRLGRFICKYFHQIDNYHGFISKVIYSNYLYSLKMNNNLYPPKNQLLRRCFSFLICLYFTINNMYSHFLKIKHTTLEEILRWALSCPHKLTTRDFLRRIRKYVRWFDSRRWQHNSKVVRFLLVAAGSGAVVSSGGEPARIQIATLHIVTQNFLNILLFTTDTLNAVIQWAFPLKLVQRVNRKVLLKVVRYRPLCKLLVC